MNWSNTRLVAMMVGAISVFLLGLMVFFWRGTAKFRQRAQYLYADQTAAGLQDVGTPA